MKKTRFFYFCFFLGGGGGILCEKNRVFFCLFICEGTNQTKLKRRAIAKVGYFTRNGKVYGVKGSKRSF